MSKRDAKIYREAAERIFLGHNINSCCAIANVEGLDSAEYYESVLALQYAALFAPYATGNGQNWGNQWAPDAANCRTLALCFMAAISEDE